MDLENFPTSPAAKRLIGYVSEEFYAKSYVAKWLYQVMGLELDEVRAIIESLPEQAFPETATWGLMYHEMKYSLPVREELSYEERRRLIYQRRDVKSPMNPYGMEQIVYALTGRTASVRDSNDDLSIPTNTFVLQIEGGVGDIDISAVIKKIKEVKQSHVDFHIRVCTMVNLTVETSRVPWLDVFTLSGTVPETSRGLRLDPAGVTIGTAGMGVHDDFPMAGNSGNAGLYPKASRVADLNESLLRVGADSQRYANEYPMTSENQITGSRPRPSRAAAITQGAVDVSGDTFWRRDVADLAGTKPDLSRGVVLMPDGVSVETATKSMEIISTLAGEQPTISTGLDQNGAGTGITATTKTYGMRAKSCGSALDL